MTQDSPPPFAPSEIATPIFSAIWSIVLLGAVRGANTISYPFDVTWARYVQRRRPVLHAIRDALSNQMGFDPAVAEILMDDWKLRRAAPRLLKPEDLAAEIALALRLPRYRFPLGDDEGRIVAATEGLRNQLSRLLEALLHAEYAASLRSIPVDTDAPQRIMALATELAGEPAIYTGDPAQILTSAATEWRRKRTVTGAFSPTFESWVADRTSKPPFTSS